METIRNSDPFRMGAARHMRKHPTAAEDALWQALRRNNLGHRVRRQYTCMDYVMDFYIHAAKLCIEVDGPLHDLDHDRRRDLELGEKGILTVRIPADQIPAALDYWCLEIERLCHARVAQQERLRKEADLSEPQATDRTE